MPGGIGSIDRKLAQGLRCNDRATGLNARSTHMEIYYNLGMDRVHYVPQTQFLYFPHSSFFPILKTLEAVFAGMDVSLQIEQLYMDEGHFYKGAQRVELSAETVRPVLTAFRLKGIKISIASD